MRDPPERIFSSCPHSIGENTLRWINPINVSQWVLVQYMLLTTTIPTGSGTHSKLQNV